MRTATAHRRRHRRTAAGGVSRSYVLFLPLVVNAFAESTVRIQGDRGHAVVGDGPYRIVRHPMYLGTIVGVPGVALMLGSALSLAPMAGIVALFVWRTAREDRTLRQDLAGYEDYARRTRFRLVPGMW